MGYYSCIAAIFLNLVTIGAICVYGLFNFIAVVGVNAVLAFIACFGPQRNNIYLYIPFLLYNYLLVVSFFVLIRATVIFNDDLKEYFVDNGYDYLEFVMPFMFYWSIFTYFVYLLGDIYFVYIITLDFYYVKYVLKGEVEELPNAEGYYYNNSYSQMQPNEGAAVLDVICGPSQK